MAQLDTVFYVLSKSQLYSLLEKVIHRNHHYIEFDEMDYKDALELAIKDVLSEMIVHPQSIIPVIPKFAKLRYWLYRQRVWRSHMAAHSFEDWLRTLL